MDHNLCVLIDFDNIAKGSRQEGLGEFDIRIVMRRLKDIGRVLVARAYCDWERWSRHRKALAEQGVTMVELVATGHGDKNRGDIALAVDAMEMAYTRDFLDTFVILSGDSDFTPLVQRLKELNRSVIGIGTRGSTSRLIANVCDEFFFYDTLVNRRQPTPEPDDEDDDEDESAPARPPSKLKLDHAFSLLVETLENHARDEAGPVHASIVKTSMKRKLPTFSETELGFRTFARFMERAQAEGLVTLARDERAGGYRVELAPGPGEVASPPPPARRSAAPPPPPVAAEAPRTIPAAHPALELLRAEGFDIGTAEERARILDAFSAACTERNARGRRLAVQYLQGDLVQVGLDAERVKGVLMALVRIGALLHPDGDAVRGPTAPFQAPAAADELNALLEERALEILGEKRMKLTATARELLFGDQARPAPEAVPAEPAAVESEPERAPEPRRERRPRRAAEAEAAPVEGPAAEVAPAAEAAGEDEDRPGRRRRRGRGRGRRGEGEGEEPASPAAEAEAAPVEAPAPVEVADAAPEGEAAAEGDAGPRRRSRRGGRRGARRTEGGEPPAGDAE